MLTAQYSMMAISDAMQLKMLLMKYPLSCFNKHAYIARGDHSFGRDLMVKALPENKLHAGMI